MERPFEGFTTSVFHHILQQHATERTLNYKRIEERFSTNAL